MPNKCIICRLGNTAAVSLHSFPCFEKYPEFFNAWLRAVGGETNPEKYKNRKICSQHFEEKYFNRCRRLNKMAVPTLFLTGSLESVAEQLNLQDVTEDSSLSTTIAKKCCVPNCNSTRTDDISLHSFPNPDKDPIRFNQWIFAIGRDIVGDKNDVIYKSRRVCTLHFEKKFQGTSRKLVPTAVPTLNLPGVAMHRFPNPSIPEKIDRFRTWIMKIGGDIVGEDNLFIHRNRRICHRHFEKVYTFPNNRLTSLAIPTLHILGHRQLEESLVEKDNQWKKYSQREQGRQAGQQSLSEPNSPIDQDSQIIEDSQTELYNEALEDSPDELCEIDTEVPVEIQCDKMFSWQKSYQAESLLDSPPVEVLKLESSDGDEKVQASVPEDNQCVPQGGDQLQCCECQRVIPEHSIRCVCVSCTDGDICSVCAADDKHSYHYAIRVPAIATQSEVAEVLQKIRRVLLKESIIKEEIKEEDDDPLSSATHIVGDASYEDSISQVPNVDIQGCYRLPKSTQKMSRAEEIFKSSDEYPSEVFEGNSPRKRRRSKIQDQTHVSTQISKEPSVVLNPLENMLKRANPIEPEQNQDNRTFTHLNHKSQIFHKANIGLMKRLLGKRIVLKRLGQPQKEKQLNILDVPQKMKPVTILGAVQKQELDTNLDIFQIKGLNIKKIEDLQPKRITSKCPAQTAPAREEEPSTSNGTVKISSTKKL